MRPRKNIPGKLSIEAMMVLSGKKSKMDRGSAAGSLTRQEPLITGSRKEPKRAEVPKPTDDRR